MDPIKLYNIFTGEAFTADEILAALKTILNYVVEFVKGEI